MPIQTVSFDQDDFNSWLESTIACNYPDKEKWPEFIERALNFKHPDYLPKIGCLRKAEWLRHCDRRNLVSSWTDKFLTPASLKQEILDYSFLQAPGMLPPDKRLWEIKFFSDSDLLVSLHSTDLGAELYQRRFKFLLNKITGRDLKISFIADLQIDPVVLTAILDTEPVFEGPRGGLFRYSKSGNSKIYL